MSWKDALQRRDEVRAAFVEGLMIGIHMISPGDAPPTEGDEWRRSREGIESAWKRSRARAALGVPLEPARFDPGSFVAGPSPAALESHQTTVGAAVAGVVGSEGQGEP